MSTHRRFDGTADIAAAIAAVAACLPEPLRPLARIAYDYRWSWSSDGPALFAAIHPRRWALCNENPVRLLQEAGPAALAAAAADGALVRRAAELDRALAAERADVIDEPPVAFFCAEFAVHGSLPIYAGGLGVLAGDILKQAADDGRPVVGVGLLYRQGYFHQRLDASGWQHESWQPVDVERLPAVLVTDGAGAPLLVRVPGGAREVTLQIWRVDIGRVPLYLLDSDHPANLPVDRWITSRLYVADRRVRLAQYLALGIGGVRALRAMGIDPRLIHLNEGHAAFAALELVREGIAAGQPFAAALERARARTHFTTHTPIDAGNEVYDGPTVLRALGGMAGELGPEAVLGLGRVEHGDGFGLTPLSLRVSRAANAVSRRHGFVARAMWRTLWNSRTVDEVPIDHVTNGVHLPTWMGPEMHELLARHLAPGWERREDWRGVEAIPDEELWAVRDRMRARLVAYVRERSQLDRLSRGDTLEYVEAAARTFDPGVLTVGFARRLATYKRLYLVSRDPARSLSLLTGPRQVQFCLAGKAHPADDEAKRVVREQLFPMRAHPVVGARVAYLEDYDLGMAMELVRGCDVWLNLPRPPLEASGTSGMKAALNGALNLSVLDGWWSEAYDGSNGWGIGGGISDDWAAQDEQDSATLHAILEGEVLPLFYDRDAAGVPRGWVARVKRSLITNGPRFAAARMVGEYGERWG